MLLRTPCIIACSVLIVGLTLLRPDAAQAQDTGQLSEKPIAIFYSRNLPQRRLFEYGIGLTERLDFAESVRGEMREQIEDENELDTGVPEPVEGYACFLKSGPLPDFEFIYFCKVADVDSAKRLLEAENSHDAPSLKDTSLKDAGNDCFITERRFRTAKAIPEGADEVKFAAGNATDAESNGITQAKHETTRIVEIQDGKKMAVETTINRSFYRYHDQFLYTGDSAALFNVTLPSGGTIDDGAKGAGEYGFSVFLDRVPKAVRQVGWDMVSSGLGLQMQQYDGETDTSYNMRRASSDVVLAIANATLFDIDFVDGSLKFATEDTPFVDGNLRVRARNNSSMGDKLQRTTGDSRFAAILHDNAVVTNHACIRFPEESSMALRATGDWIKELFAAEFGDDPTMLTAADTLAETLTGMAEHRNLELLFKVGFTEESSGVIYGGIQLHDIPQLLPTIQQLMLRVLAELLSNPSAGSIGQGILPELINDGDIEFIRIALPQDMIDAIAGSWGARITHIYLAHQNSCLWYAVGGENAKEIIRASVERCHESSATRTPFLTSRIDMEKWLAYPQDDPTGIAQMPRWLDQNSWLFPPNPWLILSGAFEGPDRKPQEIMQRAFDLGGSQQFSLTLQADESGLLLQMNLGEALGNHMLARLIEMESE